MWLGCISPLFAIIVINAMPRKSLALLGKRMQLLRGLDPRLEAQPRGESRPPAHGGKVGRKTLGNNTNGCAISQDLRITYQRHQLRAVLYNSLCQRALSLFLPFKTSPSLDAQIIMSTAAIIPDFNGFQWDGPSFSSKVSSGRYSTDAGRHEPLSHLGNLQSLHSLTCPCGQDTGALTTPCHPSWQSRLTPHSRHSIVSSVNSSRVRCPWPYRMQRMTLYRPCVPRSLVPDTWLLSSANVTHPQHTPHPNAKPLFK